MAKILPVVPDPKPISVRQILPRAWYTFDVGGVRVSLILILDGDEKSAPYKSHFYSGYHTPSWPLNLASLNRVVYASEIFPLLLKTLQTIINDLAGESHVPSWDTLSINIEIHRDYKGWSPGLQSRRFSCHHYWNHPLCDFPYFHTWAYRSRPSSHNAGQNCPFPVWAPFSQTLCVVNISFRLDGGKQVKYASELFPPPNSSWSWCVCVLMWLALMRLYNSKLKLCLDLLFLVTCFVSQWLPNIWNIFLLYFWFISLYISVWWRRLGG